MMWIFGINLCALLIVIGVDIRYKQKHLDHA